MSYTPVYSSRINWENEPSIASPINATNLNKMDYALKAHDDTLVNWDITKANESDLLLSLKSVDYDTDTGEFVFTWWNGTTKTVDLNIEKIPVSFSMSPQGVITMTTDDGTTYTADVGALIKTYTFTDSSEIDFTVTTDASGNKTITASIVAGSIDGTKLTPNYLADCTAAKTGAETAEGKAEDSAEDAEAWAVGTRGGVPVPSTDPAYENNAEYWAHHTSSSLAGLTDTDINNPQNGQVPVYNSTTNKWENQNQSAGGGSTITVTTSESALYGQSVTITDGVTTLTETFSNSGEATFTGVTLTGTLTLASGGASMSISIPYFGNYSFILSLFTATVIVTYPAGASCTLSDGVTTLTGTGSPMAFSVPNAGTWTATVTLDGASKTDSAVITTDGQTASITIEYGTINVTYDNAFRGTSITCVQSGTTITKTAPSGANTMTFYPPTTGNWVISGTVGGTPYSKTANVASLSTSVSVSLETVPDGKTTTPTDDIEKWLQCGQITGKSYTTLSQVLDDAETYERLLSDSNACDYMARSTTWALQSGLVPVMTSATTPSGEAFATTEYSGYPAWKAFDGVENTAGWCSAKAPSIPQYLGYHFTSAVVVRKFSIIGKVTSGMEHDCTLVIEGSNDNSAYTPVSGQLSYLGAKQSTTQTFSFSNNTAYEYYRVKFNDNNTYNSASDCYCQAVEIQFYADADITTSQDAMMRLGKYDYACDVLLSDSTWCTAICNSTYFEYVLDVKVPTMTSNTAPSGTASASAESSSYEAYKAFDNNNSTKWNNGGNNVSANTDTTGYLQYEFTNPVCVCALKYYNDSNKRYTKQLVVKGSNNGTDFTPIYTYSTEFIGGTGTEKEISFANGNAYKYYRLEITQYAKEQISGLPYVNILQFYGRHTAQTDIIVTAHGGDTVYYMENGSPVPLTTADSDTGIGTVDWSDLPKGAITLYSSTAKNPSDLTADYSKTVYITENTTQIYLMPDNALYWYGWESADLEDCTTANGWGRSGYTFTAPTRNYYYLSCPSSSNNYVCIGKKTSITDATIKSVVKGDSIGSGTYGSLEVANSKSNVSSSIVDTAITDNSVQLKSISLTNAQTGYPWVGAYNNRACTIYALLYEIGA